MPFPFLSSLFFLSGAYSALPCTLFVLLPFYGVFQLRCWQQEELQTVWISFSFMGNCSGGRVPWALVMLLTCTHKTVQKVNACAKGEGSGNTKFLGFISS